MRARLLIALLPALLGSAAPPRATIVAEPRSAGVGEIVEVEILATGPAGQRLLPLALPDLPGFWLLSSEQGAPEPRARDVLQRLRLRLRAREPGVHLWPLREVSIEDAQGAPRALPLPELSIEVHSLLAELPARQAPYGLRAPPAAPAHLFFGLGLACGAAGALVILALRRRAGARRMTVRETTHAEAGEQAHTAVLQPAASWARDPREAAGQASGLVRDRLERGFGVAAQCATREELAARGPARGDRAEWSGLLALLRRLDAWRFEPAPAEDLGGCLAETRRLVGPGGGDPEPRP